MTPIQELEQLSQKELVALYQRRERQHKADIDELSKALAIKKFSIPDGYLLVPKNPTTTMQCAGSMADIEYFEKTGRRCMSLVFKAMIEKSPDPFMERKPCEHLFLFVLGMPTVGDWTQRRCLYCLIDEQDLALYGGGQ